MKDNRVYTLEEAYNQKIVHESNTSIDKLFYMLCTAKIDSDIDFNWTLSGSGLGINIPFTIHDAALSAQKLSLKAGQTKKIKCDWDVTKWKTSNSKVAIVKKGKITGLQKGTAVITAILDSSLNPNSSSNIRRKLKCTVKVTTNPKLAINSKTVKNITVRKGKTKILKLSGKVSGIKNKYTNTKYVRVISKANAKNIKILGVKKGTSTIRVKVNGVKTISLKVKVKK